MQGSSLHLNEQRAFAVLWHSSNVFVRSLIRSRKRWRFHSHSLRFLYLFSLFFQFFVTFWIVCVCFFVLMITFASSRVALNACNFRCLGAPLYQETNLLAMSLVGLYKVILITHLVWSRALLDRSSWSNSCCLGNSTARKFLSSSVKQYITWHCVKQSKLINLYSSSNIPCTTKFLWEFYFAKQAIFFSFCGNKFLRFATSNGFGWERSFATSDSSSGNIKKSRNMLPLVEIEQVTR